MVACEGNDRVCDGGMLDGARDEGVEMDEGGGVVVRTTTGVKKTLFALADSPSLSSLSTKLRTSLSGRESYIY